MARIECSHRTECTTGKRDPSKCKTCKNNTMRNFEEDFYNEAKDNPIPNKCPALSYDGPAEQTAGYKCPVCGSFTNPYMMRDSLCGGCGYKLNTRR